MLRWLCSSPRCDFEEVTIVSRYCMWCGQDMLAVSDDEETDAMHSGSGTVKVMQDRNKEDLDHKNSRSAARTSSGASSGKK